MSVTGQPTITYEYDVADRLLQITQGTSMVTILPDENDRRHTVTLPNDVVVSYGYDSASRVTSISAVKGGTALVDLTYAYDQVGDVAARGGTSTRPLLPAVMTGGTYDTANEITAWGGIAKS
jgi:hypothetical protein